MSKLVCRALFAVCAASGVFVPAAEARRANWHLGDRAPLKRGMVGHDVRVLQGFLTRAGHTTGVDGQFGSGTTRSVRAFERAHRRRPDGMVTRGEIRLLRRAASTGGAAAVPAPQPAPAPAPAPTPVPPAPAPAGGNAVLGPDGVAVAPADAPEAVKQMIAAANRIATKPYTYGGGHARIEDVGYDCSGSISYALHHAGLLATPLPSGTFMRWGDAGPGQWVTIYAHPSHAYMVVAGLRYDTTARKQTGNRWSTEMRGAGSGYVVRHPAGL